MSNEKNSDARRHWRMGPAAAVMLSAAGFGLTLPGAAQAQQPAPTPSASEDEVIVTARRREERLQDVPVAITAVSSEMLDRYNVTAVGDLTTFVPSFVVGRQVTGSSASVFLRGVGSTSLSAGFAQSVSLNLDGIPMSRGRELLFSQYDVQGMEVLKGPQALYFGRNATGGLISVTTRGPSDAFEASGKVGYGFEADETYGEAVISGPVAENLGMRLALRATNSEGAFTNSAAAATDGVGGLPRQSSGARRGASESFSGRLTVAYDPSQDFNLTFKLGLTDYSDDGAGTLYERVCGSGRTTPRPSGGVADPYADCSVNGVSPHSAMPQAAVGPWWRYVRDGKPYTDLSTRFAVLNGTYDFGALSLNSITGHYHFKQQDSNDFLGATRTNGVTQLADFDQNSEELRLTSEFEGPLNFMIGAFYGDSNFVFNTDTYLSQLGFDPINRTYNTFNRDDGFDATTFSVFAQGTWNITPTVELAGGARWSRDERDSFQLSLPAHTLTAGTFPPNRRIEDKFRDENVSPEVTLSWRPNTDVSYYVGYKQGYKSGGFNLSQTITAAASRAAGQFKSEGASGFEGGVRSTLFDGALRLNATLYDYLYEDLQVQFYDPVTSGQRVANAGELRTKGLEADFNWLPPQMEALSLHGSIAYNHARYDNFKGQCYAGQVQATGCNQDLTTVYNNQVFSGRTPPKAPEWAGTIGGAYDFAVASNVSGRVTLDANYSSEYNYTDTLRPDGVQDAYTQVHASIALMNEERGWKLSLIGRNLTDELVINTANDMTATGAGTTGAPTPPSGIVPTTITPDMNAIIERPREIYLELSLDF